MSGGRTCRRARASCCTRSRNPGTCRQDFLGGLPRRSSRDRGIDGELGRVAHRTSREGSSGFPCSASSSRSGSSQWNCLSWRRSRCSASTCRSGSLLAPGFRELIAEGLQQVRENGSLSGLNEAFDGHAGDEPEAIKTLELAFWNFHPDRVKSCSSSLFLGDVGGNAAYLAVDLGRRPSIEGRKAQDCSLPKPDLVNVLGGDTSF